MSLAKPPPFCDPRIAGCDPGVMKQKNSNVSRQLFFFGLMLKEMVFVNPVHKLCNETCIWNVQHWVAVQPCLQSDQWVLRLALLRKPEHIALFWLSRPLSTQRSVLCLHSRDEAHELDQLL